MQISQILDIQPSKWFTNPLGTVVNRDETITGFTIKFLTVSNTV